MTDQYVRLQYADDGQPNFSNWDEQSIGEVGEYAKRIVWTRLWLSRAPSPVRRIIVCCWMPNTCKNAWANPA